MGQITVTPPESATQMATWTTTESDGKTYKAYVARTSHRGDYGKTGWAYHLSVGVPGGVGFGRTFADPAELIYAHDTDPARVLETLASFVAAWDEAQRYEGSDNRDIFPASCLPFLAVAEEFAIDTMEPEEEEEE